MSNDVPVYAEALASDLPAGWCVAPFEDLVFFQEGPGIRNWQYVDQGVPFVNIRCLVDGRLDRASMSSVSANEAFGKYRHFLLETDDYVVSSSGTLGRIATVHEEDLPCMLNTSVIRMRPQDGHLDRRYLKYFLLSSYYQTQVKSFATGSAQLNYGPSHLRQMFIVAPPIDEQRTIAGVLGALDDKIEQNRRTAQTLEKLARAIFRAWFVDFEPVKAKAAGATSFSSMPQLVFDALPTRFVDSAIGPVPEGWGASSVYDFANVTYGAPFSSKLFNNRRDGFPLIRIRDLQSHDPTVFTPEKHTKGTLIRPADIVVGMDGEFRLHYWLGPDAWLNQRLCKFGPKTGIPRMFLGEALRGPLAYFEGAKTGTTVIHLGKADIDTFCLVRPEPWILNAFGQITDSLLELFVHAARESRKLAEMRDYLLPKLLSGQIRVRDAERAAATVA